MLGWKANSGVVKGHEGRYYLPSNISEIEFLDTGKYLVIPHIANMNSIDIGRYSLELPYSQYGEIASRIESFFGQEWIY